jgi:Interleukin-like EMT inducer
MKARAHLAVFAGFLGLVALYTWPLARDPAHLWASNHDPRLFTWVMLTIARNLVTQPALLLHGNAFYPIGNSLTFSEPLLTPALLVAPLSALTGNPVLAHNLGLLLLWALSGWATYLVAFRLTGRHAAAFVAAAIFTLAPYRTELFLSFQMEMAFGLPLCVYGLVRWLETQRPRDLVFLLAIFWVQAVAVWYYAVIGGLALLVVALHYAALRWVGWRPRALGQAAAGGVALAVALAPVAWPFFVTRRELGFERGLGEVSERAADVLTYLEVRSNWLYRVKSPGYFTETSLFLGGVGLALALLGLAWLPRGRRDGGALERWLGRAALAALALAALALVTLTRLRATPARMAPLFTALVALALGALLARSAVEGWRRRRAGQTGRDLGEREWAILLLGLAGVAFLLSLGPDVTVAGRAIGSGLYAWLYPYLFPLRAIRASTRFGILVVLAGALLAGLGVKWLGERLPGRARAPVLAGLALLLLLEYATFPLPYGRVAPGLRQVDQALRREGDEGAVLELPANVPDMDAEAMFRSLGHGRRVINGYGGFIPDLLTEMSGLMTDAGPPFPVPAAQAALRRIYPLRWIVVRPDDGMDEPWRSVWQTLRREAPPILRFHGRFGAEDLYEIVPLPERGLGMERWVSYEFLHGHPVLRLVVRPVRRREDLEQWVEVRLNGRPVERLQLDGEARAARRVLTPPFAVAAPNVIDLQYRYARPPATRDGRYRIGTTGAASPGDLRVLSVGQSQGSASSVELNGVELSPDRRGYNLVALDPGGRVREAAAFDTFFEADAAERLAAWVARLPAGTIVAGAVRDEASGQLTEGAVRALGMLGVRGDLRGRFREAHAFVGVKGAAPGTALEELGPRRIELEVGRIELRAGQPAPGVGLELAEFALEPAVTR